MKKINLIEIIIQSVVVLFFVICLCIFPIKKTPSYYVSFAFSIIALISYIVVLRLRKKDKSDEFLKLIYPVIGAIFSFLQMVWNAFVLGTEFLRIGNIIEIAQEKFLQGTVLEDAPISASLDIVSWATNIEIKDVQVVSIAVSLNVIVNLLLMLVYIVVGFLTYKSVHEIETSTTNTHNATVFLKTLRMEIEFLRTATNDENIKKCITKMSDTAQYSNPVSTEASRQIENTIWIHMNKLKDAIKNEDKSNSMVLVGEIEQMLNERNMYCTIRK